MKIIMHLGPAKWWFSKGHPLISGKSRLVKYYSIWPESWFGPFKKKEFDSASFEIQSLMFGCNDLVTTQVWAAKIMKNYVY